MAKLKIPAAILAAIVGGGGAYAILDAAVPIVEGNPLVAYQDVGGVWTICGGVTEGVKPGQVETVAGCQRRNAAEIRKGLAHVERCVKAPMPETRKAGLALFAYNVGGGAFYVAGKDCREASSGCPGIVHRRALERALCEWPQ